MHMKPFATKVGSAKLTTICLLMLAALTVWGTLYQVDHGLYAAQQRFFNSWILLVGGIFPFPGVKLCALFFVVNLIFSMVFRLTWTGRNIGLIICYAGTIFLFAGVQYTSTRTVTSSIELREGQSSSFSFVADNPDGSIRHNQLPFIVTLVRFVKCVYPGTDIARSFESVIHVRGPDIDQDAIIAMNRPFRYNDYSFYQASYAEVNGFTTSTLAVVKNPGRLLPPIAGATIVLGLLFHCFIHLVMVVRKKQQKL